MRLTLELLLAAAVTTVVAIKMLSGPDATAVGGAYAHYSTLAVEILALGFLMLRKPGPAAWMILAVCVAGAAMASIWPNVNCGCLGRAISIRYSQHMLLIGFVGSLSCGLLLTTLKTHRCGTS